MLIKPERPKYFKHPGDDTLYPFVEPVSKEEELARQKEYSYAASQVHRIRGQEEYTNYEARLGRVLHSGVIVEKLRKLIPSLYVTNGAPGCLALYSVTENGNWLRYGGWIYSGLSPEYSSYQLGANDIPTQERRGWRTILMRFIKAGLLTERQVLREFGRPSNGHTAKQWNKQLYLHRNKGTNNVGKQYHNYTRAVSVSPGGSSEDWAYPSRGPQGTIASKDACTGEGAERKGCT